MSHSIPRRIRNGASSSFAAAISSPWRRTSSAARDRYQARVLLHAPIDQVADRVPPTVGTLEPLDERTCLLRTGSDWLGGLAVYVADIGVDFEVLDPPEFVEQVRRLADRFGRAAG